MPELKIDFLTEYDDASLIAELQRIAQVTGSDMVTKADILRVGRVSHSAIVKRFGSLRRATELASLRSSRFMKATDEELIAIIIDLWQKVLEKEGRTPQQEDLKKYGFPVSNDTMNRRFGSWRKALVKAHASITEDSVSESAAVPETAAAPRKREALSLRKRFFVLKRDHFACVRCGASGVGVRLEVHHRFPFAKGGSDALVNLETLCYDCNRGQRDSVV
ncbi:MAG TPA: HNH endonuclease [Ramlibacter sp.]|nr:HNH endonuclease [Ramlibacter sp.]